jgi:hypothetical protein
MGKMLKMLGDEESDGKGLGGMLARTMRTNEGQYKMLIRMLR